MMSPAPDAHAAWKRACEDAVGMRLGNMCLLL